MSDRFMASAPTADRLLNLLDARKGHFRLESGHHGDLWLDVERLWVQPTRLRHLALALARRLAPHRIEAICGPLVEGSFIALMVACELDVEFFYAERYAPSPTDALYPVEYRIPNTLRRRVDTKRVAIVNDVINGGSAVRGTSIDLLSCGANTVAVGALLVLGSWASRFVAEKGIVLETTASLPNSLWLPTECPLCASNVPLVDLVH
jgi:orotate phosphoribosyltransferase